MVACEVRMTSHPSSGKGHTLYSELPVAINNQHIVTDIRASPFERVASLTV